MHKCLVLNLLFDNFSSSSSLKNLIGFVSRQKAKTVVNCKEIIMNMDYLNGFFFLQKVQKNETKPERDYDYTPTASLLSVPYYSPYPAIVSEINLILFSLHCLFSAKS